jgi:hypothetical protein
VVDEVAQEVLVEEGVQVTVKVVAGQHQVREEGAVAVQVLIEAAGDLGLIEAALTEAEAVVEDSTEVAAKVDQVALVAGFRDP